MSSHITRQAHAGCRFWEVLALQKHYLGVHFADAPDANDKHQLGTWFRHETAFGLQGPLDAHSIPFLQVGAHKNPRCGHMHGPCIPLAACGCRHHTCCLYSLTNCSAFLNNVARLALAFFLVCSAAAALCACCVSSRFLFFARSSERCSVYGSVCMAQHGAASVQ